MWIKDKEGNLLNLNHCAQVLVEESYGGPDEDTHQVVAVQLILNAEVKHELFSGSPTECEEKINRLYSRLTS